MGPLRRDGRRSTWPLALHALLQSWIILRLGCRGVRDHSATPSRKHRAVPSPYRLDTIDDASFVIDRQDRNRDDLSYYIGHFFRLAWAAAANLLLTSLANREARLVIDMVSETSEGARVRFLL